MKLNYSLVFFLLFLSHLSFSQTVLRGVIQDEQANEPLIGASVLIANSGTGTVTDYDGNFELKVREELPFDIIVSYTGYATAQFTITESNENMVINMQPETALINVVEVRGQRVSDKQKASPLTVESLDLMAIKETPSDNFYDGLGSLKGVDLTAASLGFKVINMRGFNSTSPVRSLQLIDGVDNQAPGLNFSLGNFLGSSELDVLKVDLIQGASSAFYGPNAFNGVIAMTTKDPFFQKGLAASVKVGERNLVETALRCADAFKNDNNEDVFGYKINLSYLRADDWEADNFDPVFDTRTGRDNPGRYDAVNIYGDEYTSSNDLSASAPWRFVGLGQWHRTGYREVDLVNYDTRNLKSNIGLYWRLKPEEQEQSPELIFGQSYSRGTTVYQGDNRFSLQNIQFFQSKLELKKRDKYFVRAYFTRDDAGDSFDPYFTALRLQEEAKNNSEWSTDYVNYWQQNVARQITESGYPDLDIQFVDGAPVISFDQAAADAWFADPQNQELLRKSHEAAENFANTFASGTGGPFLTPGTPEFEEAFNRITSAKNNLEERGTQFFDKSALYHIQGEYAFDSEFFEYIKVGASGRLYTPNSEGTIFYDTADVNITNYEFGVYSGVEKKFYDDKITANATLRVDKNQNFNLLASPAVSLVYKPKANNFLRLSFSSAIRNPTLSDQFLNLNVGRAILAGNLNGVEDLISLESFDEYRNTLDPNDLQRFDIAPVVPEKVRTFEVGYRTTLGQSLYIDAGYYYSVYNDFLGFNIGVEVEFDQQSGLPLDIQPYRYAANSINQVTTQGFSIGANYYFWDFFSLNGNYSWNRLNKEFDDDPIIPAFNTPEHKFNIGVSGRDVEIGNLRNVGFNINYKWIEGFLFEGSPQFTGFIPTYALMDAQINFKIPNQNLTFKLGASNILNNKQFQTYGGPRIGRLAYVSAVYDWKKD